VELLAPPAFSFHHANAFEAAGGRVVLDTFCYKSFDMGATAANITSDYFLDTKRKGLMSRLVIDTKAGTVSAVAHGAYSEDLNCCLFLVWFIWQGGVAAICPLWLGSFSATRGQVKLSAGDNIGRRNGNF
jgi:hypothetical protein